MIMRRRTVGIVGAGAITANSHLPVLLSMPDVASVAWVADVNERRARQVARAYRVPFLALPASLNELPFTDLVVLAMPYGARPPYYQVLRDRTSAVFVEKPMARTVVEHQEICSWFPRHALACGLQRRSLGCVQVMRDIVDEQLFGALRSVRFGLGTRGAIGSGGFLSDPKLSGGGRLIEEGIHGVDAILFLTRAVAARVRRASTITEGHCDIHVEAALEVETASGHPFDAEITVTYLQDTIQSIECTFDHAVVSFSLYTEDDPQVVPVNGASRYSLRFSNAYTRTPFQTAYENWRRFFDGLVSGQPNRTSAADSILTTQVIEDIYRLGASSETGTANQQKAALGETR